MKPTIDQLASAAHKALDTFVDDGVAYFGDNTDEKLVDFISGIRHLSDQYGFDWDHILKRADDIYKSDLELPPPVPLGI